MIDDTESDFCERLQGQHTGRLSLELQASEAAEWQLRLDQMEKEAQRLRQWIARQETKIRELTESPAAAESPPISAEEAQAHGLTTPATPSAAVGASEPGAAAMYETQWLPGSRCPRCGAQLLTDGERQWCSFVGGENRGVHIKGCLYGLDVPVKFESPSDSKPTNCHNPESEDTLPRGNDVPATGKPFQLEHGKQYLRRDGKVSGVMTQTKGGEYSVSHPLWDDFHCLSYRPDGRYNVSEAEDKFDLISEYHEPEPIPPAESEVDRLQRELDAAVEYHDNYTSKIDKALGQPRHGGDLLTEHLREIERLTYLPQTASPPAESPPLPSPWRPMSEKPPTDSWVWLAWTSSKHVSVYRHENIWLAPSYAIAWMPATPPTHPKAPPVVPKTRTVTLWEYSVTTSGTIKRLWSEEPFVRFRSRCYATGRTCECEVPE